jgi:hypothetical protein
MRPFLVLLAMLLLSGCAADQQPYQFAPACDCNDGNGGPP